MIKSRNFIRLFQLRKRSDIVSYNEYKSCNLCPRKCGVNRAEKKTGFCGETDVIRVGRASLHMWEEPCVSGERGSGTVFFAGCPLKCCYCQNYNLSRGKKGVAVTTERLAEAFLNLKEQGAHNINLVTAEHFAPHIKDAVLTARENGLDIPVILNSSGYITEETLELLKDVIDVFLVDFKYMDAALAKKYSLSEDYPEILKKALRKMYALAGKLVFDDEGMIKKGVMVRHLCLPDCTEDSKNVIKYVYDTYADRVGLSIMSQYTPVGKCDGFPNLERKLSEKEYDSVIDYCISIGIEDAYIQEGESASESFIPEFNGII